MRLLDTRTGQFHWIDDPRSVRYAILSHVWAKQGDANYIPEQTYQDVLAIQASAARDNTSILSELSDKIRRFCEVAQADGFALGWADSCCIDKTSSAELSEAINSMYSWYRHSTTCYAFLPDVSASDANWKDTFRHSKWFTRGWTLQELIAPEILIFFSAEWTALGSKRGLASLVQKITRIDRAVLMSERPVEEVSVASRMSWAAKRVTSREEDRAYSLMGLFRISMPILYGEGAHAFIRLQEEILKTIPDQSVFAWGPIFPTHRAPLHISRFLDPSAPSKNAQEWSRYTLATSPSDFETLSDLACLSRKEFVEILGISWEDAYQTFTMTPHGVHGRFPLITASIPGSSTTSGARLDLAVLPVVTQATPRHLVALLLTRAQDKHSYTIGRPYSDGQQRNALMAIYFRGIYVSEDSLRRLVCTWARLDRPEMTNVYITQRLSDAPPGHTDKLKMVLRSLPALNDPQVMLSSWSETVLRAQGYRCIRPAAGAGPDENSAGGVAPPLLPLFLTISNDDLTEVIFVHLGRCQCEADPNVTGSLAVYVSSPTAQEPSALESASRVGSRPAHIHWWAGGKVDSVMAAKARLVFPGPSIAGGPPASRVARRKCLALRLTLTTVQEDVFPPRLQFPDLAVDSKYQLSVEIDVEEVAASS